MRIVEHEKETTSLAFQLLTGLAWISGIFSLVVCCLIIAYNVNLKKADPIHSPALLILKEKLQTDKNNEVLIEEIRELDLLARQSFFTHQHFNRMAIYMLVGGLVIFVISLKSIEAYKGVPPFPDSSDPKDDIVERANWARKAVTAVGLVLAGFALMLALPWKSNLDNAIPIAATLDGGEEFPAPEPEEEPKKTAPKPAPVAEAIPVATSEERLKNWPGLFGPEAGHSRAVGLPTKWDGESGDGIAWRTPISLPGFSSPIIWNGKIYFTGADEKSREVFCIDAESGKILWQKATGKIPGSPAELPDVTDDTGYAAATMATDGVRVFAIFANGDLIAFDLEGNKMWAKYMGTPENHYGHSSSLLVFEDILMIQFDQEEHGFLTGLDVATGKERWRTPRKFGTSWSSPALINTGDRFEVVLAADPAVVSYDPKTGEELWRVDCLERAEVAPTPVYADGLLYASADYAKLSAIDVKTQKIVWESEDLMPGVSTPIVVDEYLISGLTDGGIACHNAKTGEELWLEDTDSGFYASPIVADGTVYLMDMSGIMHIFKPGPEYKSIAMPELGEDVTCTAAIMGKSLFIRSTKNLYRIGK